MNTLEPYLRRLAGAPESALADAVLLDRFAASRDEGAFRELVRRYGPVVFGVCRRVTGNATDADDAFQATFVVLARKAGRLLNQPVLGAWLHGVARRAALKTRAAAVRRRAKERTFARPAEVAAPNDAPDIFALVEHELSRLPRRYREPLVLCVFGERSRKEAAGELGIPEGTLASRLAKAREALASRLRRRGIAPAALTLVVSEHVAVAAVPAALSEQAVQVATGTVSDAIGQIASEVSRTMLVNKLRVAALIVIGAVACAAGSLARGPSSSGAHAGPADAGEKTEDVLKKAKADRQALAGVWDLQRQIINDEEQKRWFDYYRWTFNEYDVQIESKVGGEERKADLTFSVNPTTSPPEITIYGKNMLILGIYDLKGDVLRVACFGISELERPRGFTAKDRRVSDMKPIVWELKRKPAEKQPASPPSPAK